MESTQKQKEQARVRKRRQRDKQRDIRERDTDSVTWETSPKKEIKELKVRLSLVQRANLNLFDEKQHWKVKAYKVVAEVLDRM